MTDRRTLLLQHLADALERLGEALAAPRTELHRDAAIQRFEFSFELFWKALKLESDRRGVRVFSPRDALREAFQLGLLEESDEPLRLLEDRNLTSHVYSAAMAEEIYGRLGAHLQVMRLGLEALRAAE